MALLVLSTWSAAAFGVLADPVAAPASGNHAVLRTNPDWVRRPSPDEFAAFYPRDAARRRVSGYAVIACTVADEGSLRDCKVAQEDPPDLGFGAAALKICSFFRMLPRSADGYPVGGAEITIPIRFVPPS